MAALWNSAGHYIFALGFLSLFLSLLSFFLSFLWPPCVADADIICLPCDFYLLLSSFFFYSSLNLSGRRLDVYHTSTHGVALVRI